jgi:hypothetical protein
MKRTYYGLMLLVVSILLGALFFSRGYHNFYWSHPAVFIGLTLVGVFSSLIGSFFLGSSLVRNNMPQERLHRILLVLSLILILAAVISGLTAISLAVTIFTGTGYWGQAPYSYNGDYMIMGLQIYALVLSIIFGNIGGFLLGLVFKKQ